MFMTWIHFFSADPGSRIRIKIKWILSTGSPGFENYSYIEEKEKLGKFADCESIMYKNYDLIGNFLFISMFSQGVDTAQTFLIHWGLNDFKEGGG